MFHHPLPITPEGGQEGGSDEELISTDSSSHWEAAADEHTRERRPANTARAERKASRKVQDPTPT